MNSPLPPPVWKGPPIAILWDQSLVWGLLCTQTLSVAGIPFRLLSASDLGKGALDGFRILLVPGGWAAHKARALGEPGRKQLAVFIENGGRYIGFCGGAGLALSSPPALFLTPIVRMPFADRLPSASGKIFVTGQLSHPAWKNIPPEIPVSVWWPSQFMMKAGCDAKQIAVYSTPGEGFQVADLRVCDLTGSCSWGDLEKAYGINLDPARIQGHPAAIEVIKGRGRLVLSYAHLETPGDTWGNRLFVNILEYLDGIGPSTPGASPAAIPAAGEIRRGSAAAALDPQAFAGIRRAREAASELIEFGEANLLWSWRNSWLLNWRRGVRGLEYSTLSVTLNHMARIGEGLREDPGAAGPWKERAERLESLTLEFCAMAKRLLLEEKIAAQTAVVSKLGKVNDRVDPLRKALFGAKMNHGGLCGTLFDLIDGMLLDLMRLAR